MNFESLPFVKVAATGKILDTWDVAPTGDYSVDCETGRKYFRSLMIVMHVSANPMFLTRVLAGQAAKFSDWGGIENGFHAAMADELSVQM